MTSIADFAKKIDELRRSPAYLALEKTLKQNPWIKDCTLPKLEQYSTELDMIVRKTRVPELSAETIDDINKSLAMVNANYSRVSELKIYFMRLHVEWKRYFPIIYAKFEMDEWVKSFRTKEARYAVIQETFEQYHVMAELSKFLVDKADIVLDQFRTFTFNLRDQRENLRLECQFYMSSNVSQGASQ